MSTTERNRSRLINLLKELFQLDQPELDFGLYRIMHAKSQQITQFLETDLLKEIQDAFGKADESRIAKAKADYDNAIAQARNFGAPNPEETPAAKEAFAQLEAAKNAGSNESEIYDHLYRFFERYYDGGDFMSRRYYARETEGRAAPFSVPYDGREVYLHWANKDQYYIKTSEYLTNYSFDVVEAIKQLGETAAQLNFGSVDGDKTVHFRIVDAQEGDHNNVKADQKREFIPYLTSPVEMMDGELYVNFEYKVLANGYPISAEMEKSIKTKYEASNKGDIPTLWMADVILSALVNLPDAQDYVSLLSHPAPTDKQKKRPILAKYINNYTSRNSMDYFIHKNLGQFLNRELDFYIKNEIMRLDDLETAEEAHIASYLDKVKVIRRIARALIAMLAQVEDFQKKLWLKKKFVTETQYCITLDRVPESLYSVIASNKAQHDEWVRLFAINDIVGEVGYSNPLSIEFLKVNPFLVLDTAFFDDAFKAALLNSIDNLDEQCDGLLIHSENFQALNLLQERYREQVKCIYIDPPYNTGSDGFIYKDNYQSSSWLSLMFDRFNIAVKTLRIDGSCFVSIDDREVDNVKKLINTEFSDFSMKTIAIKMSEPTGKKMASVNRMGSIPKLKEYGVLIKRGSVNGFTFEKIPKESWDDEYKTILENISQEDVEKLKFVRDKDDYTDEEIKLVDSLISNIRFTSISEYQRRENISIDDNWKYKNAWRIVQIASLTGAAKVLADEKSKKLNSGSQRDVSAFSVITPQKKMYFIKSGYDLSVSTPRVKLLFADDYLTVHPGDFWSDIKTTGLDNEGYVEFLNGKKPLKLIRRYVSASTSNNDIVLDFFGGSGTTAQAVIQNNLENKLRNMYIICEMGDYFDLKTKVRVIKTYCVEKVSGFFKYLRLESYEDTLNNLVLTERKVSVRPYP